MRNELLAPLSYIDGVNTILTGSSKVWDQALNEAACEMGLKWDRDKDWEG